MRRTQAWVDRVTSEGWAEVTWSHSRADRGWVQLHWHHDDRNCLVWIV